MKDDNRRTDLLLMRTLSAFGNAIGHRAFYGSRLVLGRGRKPMDRARKHGGPGQGAAVLLGNLAKKSLKNRNGTEGTEILGNPIPIQRYIGSMSDPSRDRDARQVWAMYVC